MKPKFLQLEIQRGPVLDRCNNERMAGHPIGAGKAGMPAALFPPTPELKQNLLLLVSDDVWLGTRLIEAAELAGLAFKQVTAPVDTAWLAGQDDLAVVLLDLDLPAPMGWEIAEDVLRNEAAPPLILLSGGTDRFDLSAAIYAGAVVEKSISPVRLVEKAALTLAEMNSDRVDRKARQLILLRWLKPFHHPAFDLPQNRFWGINE